MGVRLLSYGKTIASKAGKWIHRRHSHHATQQSCSTVRFCSLVIKEN